MTSCSYEQSLDELIEKVFYNLEKKKLIQKINVEDKCKIQEIRLYKSYTTLPNLLQKIQISFIPHKLCSNHIDVFGDDVYYGIITSTSGYSELSETLMALKSCFASNSDSLLSLSKFIKNMNGSSIIDPDILSDYDATINGNLITIYTRIQCTMYVKNKKLYKLPSDLICTIRKTVYSINDDGYLLSVKLDHIHPNADKLFYYCLGNDKLKKLNSSLIDKINKRISIYNLDDCYYDPFNA